MAAVLLWPTRVALERLGDIGEENSPHSSGCDGSVSNQNLSKRNRREALKVIDGPDRMSSASPL